MKLKAAIGTSGKITANFILDEQQDKKLIIGVQSARNKPRSAMYALRKRKGTRAGDIDTSGMYPVEITAIEDFVKVRAA